MTTGSTVSQSGVSKAADQVDGNAVLARLAECLAGCEEEAAAFALRVLTDGSATEADFEAVGVTYPKQFELYTLADLAQALTDIQTAAASAGELPETEGELLQRIISVALPGLDDDRMGALRDEVAAFMSRASTASDAAGPDDEAGNGDNLLEAETVSTSPSSISPPDPDPVVMFTEESMPLRLLLDPTAPTEGVVAPPPPPPPPRRRPTPRMPRWAGSAPARRAGGGRGPPCRGGPPARPAEARGQGPGRQDVQKYYKAELEGRDKKHLDLDRPPGPPSSTAPSPSRRPARSCPTPRPGRPPPSGRTTSRSSTGPTAASSALQDEPPPGRPGRRRAAHAAPLRPLPEGLGPGRFPERGRPPAPHRRPVRPGRADDLRAGRDRPVEVGPAGHQPGSDLGPPAGVQPAATEVK